MVRDSHLDELATYYAVQMPLNDQKDNTTDLLTNSWWQEYSGGTPQLDDQTAREGIDYNLQSPQFKDAMFRSEARAIGVGVVAVGNRADYTLVFDVINADIRLYENSKAKDPTWGQLKEFLLRDDTDQQTYISDVFVCRHFAARLHNNAERAGWKAAFVSIDFADDPVGHALNAFNTVDMGLVYIDSTAPKDRTEAEKAISSDKVAYIELGKEYGLVALGVAKGFSYSAYEEFKQLCQSYNDQSAAYDKELGAYEAKLEAYNAAIQDYNRKVAMHNSAPTEAAYQKLVADGKELDKNKADLTILKDKLDAMQEQLMSLANSLGPLSEQKGIVTNVYVHF